MILDDDLRQRSRSDPEHQARSADEVAAGSRTWQPCERGSPRTHAGETVAAAQPYQIGSIVPADLRRETCIGLVARRLCKPPAVLVEAGQARIKSNSGFTFLF